MKTTITILVAALCWILAPPARAAVPVIDLPVLAQVLQQVYLNTQQLEGLKEELRRLGDPAGISPSVARDLIQALARTGNGKTLDELQILANGIAGVHFDGNGLYRIPGELLRRADGQEIPRTFDEYRKFDAIVVGRTVYESVMADTEERRQAVRQQIRSALNALLRASTMAEVAKLQAVLQAHSAELAAIDRERDAAMARLSAQHIQNQTDADRQAVARAEERREAFRQANEKFGYALVPETAPVLIPDPHRP